jgi:hypothetical protein
MLRTTLAKPEESVIWEASRFTNLLLLLYFVRHNVYSLRSYTYVWWFCECYIPHDLRFLGFPGHIKPPPINRPDEKESNATAQENVHTKTTPVTVTYHRFVECLQHLVSSIRCACVILSSVACSALQYFPTSFHKRYDFLFKKSYSVQNIFFYFLYNFCLKISHSKNWERYNKKCTLVFLWSTRYSNQI